MHGTWIQLFLDVDPADRLIEDCDAKYREAGVGVGLEGRSSGSGRDTTEAGRCGRRIKAGCGNRMRLVLDGLKKCKEALSGQRRNPNVSNLELQPVTCGRMRGERALSQLQRINSYASRLISAVSVSHLFPLLHHFGPSTIHRSTLWQLIFFRFTRFTLFH